MKKLFRTLALMACLVLVFGASVSAQAVDFPDINTLTPETIFGSLVDPMFTGLTILFGYISGFIPVVKRWAPFYRVIAFGLVAGLGFHLFGVSFSKIALSYLFSSGLYVVVFKNIIPSPKAKLAEG